MFININVANATMYCTRCGKKIPDSSVYCNSCGVPLGYVKSHNNVDAWVLLLFLAFIVLAVCVSCFVVPFLNPSWGSGIVPHGDMPSTINPFGGIIG